MTFYLDGKKKNLAMYFYVREKCTWRVSLTVDIEMQNYINGKLKKIQNLIHSLN